MVAGKNSGSGWIDISAPIRDGMVHWPGDPGVSIRRVSDVERGDGHTLSELTMGSHTGTHIDAPLHFLKGGKSIADMPPDMTVGKARVLLVGDARSITANELTANHVRRGERILFRTRNSDRDWPSRPFMEDFVALSRDAVDYLAERGVRTIGVDYLSVGPYGGGGSDMHRHLLNAGVWIIEGLYLHNVTAGRYDLVCLPLRIERGDGSPARAIIRRVKE